MSIRIDIIGAGRMEADHARIIAEDCPGAVLQVVCDASTERARKVAGEHGASDVATDPVARIRRADVEAVLIASPDETHAPLPLASIDDGWMSIEHEDVLLNRLEGLEKPIALLKGVMPVALSNFRPQAN